MRSQIRLDLDGDQLFDDANGPTLTTSFRALGVHVIAVRAADCLGSATAGTNVWVLKKPPTKCPSGKPFDLLWTADDANGLPLNPEWRWQCDYPGFPAGGTYPATYPDPSALCNNFRLTSSGQLDVGNDCSSQITNADAPTDLLWYTICHFIPTFPFEEPNDTLHGHVNWRPVTYEGTVKLERVQQDFPYGDGDVDLNLSPDSASGPQTYTQTPPGITWENETSIHIEFTADEVFQAFALTADHEASWATALAGIGGPNRSAVQGIAVGLLGLDARHGAYSEVHPIYAIALREEAGPGYAKWLIFARNGGDEGGCSDKKMHWLITPQDLVTLSVPLPGRVRQFSTAGSTYSANFSASPEVSVVPTRTNAMVRIRLPAPPQYGVVAGELFLRVSPTVGPPPSALLTTAHASPHYTAAVEPQLHEPEDFLGSLAQLQPSKQQADTLRVPLTPQSRRPLTAAEACTLLRPDALNKLAQGQNSTQVHLTQEICKVAGLPFH